MNDDDLEEIAQKVNQIIEEIETDGEAILLNGDLEWLRNVLTLVEMH